MGEDDDGSRKETGDQKRKKLSNSPFLKNSRFLMSESQQVDNPREVERDNAMSEELGIQLIKVVQNPSHSGEKVKELLSQGAPVNYQDKFSGATALHYAAGYNDIGAVEAIMVHPDVNYLIRDKQNRLASELLDDIENPELFEILVKKEKEQAGKKGSVAHLNHDESIEGGPDDFGSGP